MSDCTKQHAERERPSGSGEGFLRITELRLFSSSLEKSIAATSEFVRYQAGQEVDGCHRFRLGLVQTGFEHGSDAAQALSFS